MKTRMKQALVTAVMTVAAGPVLSGDLVVGLGVEDDLGAGDSSDATLSVEWHGAPAWQAGAAGLGFAVAGRADDGGDLWVGAGLSGTIAVAPRWIVEGSVMPGAYAESDDDLGSGFEIRSLIGLGYRVGPRSVLGLGVSHISNAGVADRNPGLEAVSLRLRRAF